VNILMIAPQPVFSPRGTPISVVNRCRALSALGHTVDLVTYPLGENVAIENVRWLRAPRIPGIRSVKIGPSAAKLPLDAAVLARATVQAIRGRRRYDVVHTHEEAGVFGWWFSRLLGIPHLYDMHNGLTVVLVNYGFGERHPVVRTFEWLERKMLGSARSVIVVFPSLAREADRHVPGTDPEIIYNVPIEPRPNMALAAQMRNAWAPDGEPVVLYTGTLEPYQGMPLLVDAMAHVSPMPDGRRPRLVIVGGRPDQVAGLRTQADALGLGDRVLLTGLRPPQEMTTCMAAADVLVSPRSSGDNTPLKIYSYMHSGRPIVATRIESHTQVMDDLCALLVEPDAASLAAGIDAVLADPALAARLGAASRERGERHFSVRAFLEGTARAYVKLGAPYPDRQTLDAAVRRLEPASIPGGGDDLDVDVA
jgi:glycosyltransferase involved in cell wall biosynthesis